MKLIKQHIKTKKSEKLKKKFFHILKSLFTKYQSENLLQENVCDVDIIEFEKLFNVSKKKLYNYYIIFLFDTLRKSNPTRYSLIS